MLNVWYAYQTYCSKKLNILSLFWLVHPPAKNKEKMSKRNVAFATTSTQIHYLGSMWNGNENGPRCNRHVSHIQLERALNTCMPKIYQPLKMDPHLFSKQCKRMHEFNKHKTNLLIYCYWFVYATTSQWKEEMKYFTSKITIHSKWFG